MRAPEVPNMCAPEASNRLEKLEPDLSPQVDGQHAGSRNYAENIAGASAQVQAESSANDAHGQQPDDDDATKSEDESDSDLVVPPSPCASWINKHHTPPTGLTVLETPGRHARPDSRGGQEIPFSTAPEQSDGEVMVRTSSQSAAFESRNSPSTGRSEGLDSQSVHGPETQKSGVMLINQVNDMDSSEGGSQSTFSAAKTTKTSQVTYGTAWKRGKKVRPVTKEEHPRHLDQTVAFDQSIEIPLTSDARDEHATAAESAKRSMRDSQCTASGRCEAASERSPVPQKRSYEHVDIDGAQTEMPHKRARQLLAVSVRSDDVDTQGYERHAEEDVIQVSQPRKHRALPPRFSGRSKEPVRENTASTGDEIIVAPSLAKKAKARRFAKATEQRKGKGDRQPLPSQGIIRRSGTPASSILTDGVQSPKLLLSSTSLSEKKNTTVLNWLRRQNMKIATEVPGKRSHFFCLVAHDRLPRTAKVLRSLALGKLVVSEQWAFRSFAEKKLLRPEDFVYDALQDRNAPDEGVFKGKTLFFTKALQQEYGDGWDDVQTLIDEAGPASASTGSSSDASQAAQCEGTILLGSRGDDPDAAKLSHEYGHRVYSKDLLTTAILRGKLDTDSDEFLLTPAKPKKADTRKR
ncbi:FHA domain binding [Teratosphaeria destructans]|uniref:FHA domain binding n=1 Tax=Teratosphaeria destructans TaxID=418781 RepID=A0A9W7SL98_9PEZI|nr:FHA domain binding [Teratosphaeria destructans]